MPELSLETYGFEGLERLETPCLLVYEALVEENLRRIGAELERLRPGSGLTHLRPHVKTHKSAWTTRRQLAAGVERFKCTPNELDMLLAEGARDIFVAYPPLPELAARLAQAARGPACIISQVACVEHARALSAAAIAAGVTLAYLVDCDVGDHRTGLPPEQVAGLLERIADLPGLRFAGLHAYDGHNHSKDAQERQVCAREAMGCLVAALNGLGPVERLVVSGSPGSLHCLEELLVRHRLALTVEASPGTFIYWDTKYDGLTPGRFRLAALLLARVMDRPTEDRITLNLGHKRCAVDQGPPTRFSVAGLEAVKISEEHMVLSHDGESAFAIGDSLLIAPQHVCPTINQWDRFTLVRADGTTESHPVTARNR